MRAPLAVAMLVVAACSPGESEGSSTSSTPTTSPVATSTSEPATTTSTTTTTIATTTTEAVTTTLAEGSWADLPLVTTDFGALGWWDGAGWVDSESEGALPVVGGEDYQTIVLDSAGSTTGGPQSLVCEPLQLLGVVLDDPTLLGEFPGPYGVAVSAPWDLQPHLFTVTGDSGTYASHASALLAERGLDVPSPVVTQVIRTDLEGDGVEEALVVAQELTPGLVLEPGDYSIAFMRKLVEGEVQTAVLGETIVEHEGDQFGAAHAFGTVADLNGDATMEIVLDEAFFEGFAVTVWEYRDDDLGPLVVLQRGCGS